MKFSIAILLFAQYAAADGHEAATTAATTTTTAHTDHGHDGELEAHVSEQHQRLKMALDMVEMFCDHHDENEGMDDTDKDAPETGDEKKDDAADAAAAAAAA